MKIKGVLNAAWSPQSNQVERLHKWLGAALRLLFDKYDMDADEGAEVAMYIYRSTPCQVTKFTPYMLDKGREPRFPTDVFEGNRAEVTEAEYAAEHLQEVLPKIWDAAIAARMEAQEIAAEHYNGRHGKPIDIVTGDLVFCEDHRYNATNLPTKMLPKCTGPWKVLRVTTRSAELKHVHSGIEKPANLRHLRKCKLTPMQVEKLSNKDQWHEAEVLGQVPGAMVIVNTPIIGFNVGKLVRTQDDYVSWTIQWFNIKDAGVEGKSRLTNTYLPCWIDKTSGEEIRSVLQPENSDPTARPVQERQS